MHFGVCSVLSFSAVWMSRLSAHGWDSGASRHIVCTRWDLLPCKSLPPNVPLQLLGLSIATLSTVTHYGLRFTVISNISPESNSYRVIHHAGMSRSCLSKTSEERRIWGLEDALGLKESCRHCFSHCFWTHAASFHLSPVLQRKPTGSSARRRWSQRCGGTGNATGAWGEGLLQGLRLNMIKNDAGRRMGEEK